MSFAIKKDKKPKGKVIRYNFIGGKSDVLSQTKKVTRKVKSMGVPVQPLRSKEDIQKSIEYFISRPERYRGQNIRDCAIFIIGINILKRAGDLLGLTWDCLLDENHKIKSHLSIREQKNKKHTVVAINEQAKETIRLYYDSIISSGREIKLDEPVFPSREKSKDGSLKPMTVKNLYKKMKALEKELELAYPIGTHTLRKTLPYAMLRENPDNAEITEEISELLGHSSVKTTRMYLGLTQERKDNLLVSAGRGSMSDMLKKHGYNISSKKEGE